MKKEILIIRLSSIGDVLHCTPVASALKAAWPDCRITWLIGEVSADIIKYNPYIDEIMIWSRERFEQYLRALDFLKALEMWRRLRHVLATRKFFAVLDIHGLFLTGMIAKLARSEKRIGMSDTKELNALFMTETARPLGRHITDRYLGVLQPLGITTVDRRMTMVVPEEAERSAAELLGITASSRNKIAVLAPGTTWASKNWPADFYAQAARLLYDDFTIVLCGGKAEIPLGREIETRAGIPLTNAIGRTGLLEMAGIIQKAAVLVAGDTGPLYIAAAIGIPTVAIFGPTDPAKYAPKGDGNAVLFSRQPCSFCHKMVCPKGHANCMSGVAPKQVSEQVYRVIGRKSARLRSLPGSIESPEYGNMKRHRARVIQIR